MTHSLVFGLQRWCLWHSAPRPSTQYWPNGSLLEGPVDVGFIPMMQRRRLSPLAKTACAVAWNCWQTEGQMPVVYYSAHGESQYYFELLSDMAAGEPPSPSRFSLSVHNAIAGIFGLHSASRLPYVALAGGGEGIFGGFLEAAGLLLEVPKVMLVAYEQPLPTVYNPYLSTSNDSWAVAMILTNPANGLPELSVTRHQSVPASNSKFSDADIIRAIESGCDVAEFDSGSVIWRWKLTHQPIRTGPLNKHDTLLNEKPDFNLDH